MNPLSSLVFASSFCAVLAGPVMAEQTPKDTSPPPKTSSVEAIGSAGATAGASADPTNDPEPDEAEAKTSAEVIVGPSVPTSFVVTSFFRRAALVLDRPPEKRPDFFATFGCSPGGAIFESCSELIRQAAAVHLRETNADTAAGKQANLDGKAKEIGQLYARLLNLLGNEQAIAFHHKVEEVRATVMVAISDLPGQDLMQASRCFDRELLAGFPAAASLPGYVVTPPEVTP